MLDIFITKLYNFESILVFENCENDFPNKF